MKRLYKRFQTQQVIHTTNIFKLPKTPRNLSVSNVTNVEATLEWEGEAGEIYVNDELLIQEASSPFNLENLTEATEYRVKVINSSGESETITFKTKHLVTETIVLDFKDKVSGSKKENPHLFKGGTVAADSLAFGVGLGEHSTLAYGQAADLDGIASAQSTSVKDRLVQRVMVFDIVEEVIRKFPNVFQSTTLDGKVEELKIKVSDWKASIFGYGIGATGSKLSMALWREDSWGVVGITNDTNVIKEITWIANFPRYLQSDGCVYITAFAPPSDGTISSIVYLDYVSVELTIHYLAD